ncbi:MULTISPECIES: hypothetical protein [Paraburkholderia]|uniref:hypothetical protein n=1 Tax=Paraburkholderia TaxID=1822464 RepID=UPI0022569B7E|nr:MULTISPECIES: hypothetical protein [Paraburkholderia]MCX4165035.1 hypothetical protein [Paraburkholderia megapolitana]MDN7160528.1 hypothetical protein [Paraburkholderia sp. CHISQ3]MDQ6497575.1 hypothetical protein [Paraburkholderia megapolitana]
MKMFIAKVETGHDRTVHPKLTPEHRARYKVRPLGEHFDAQTWRSFRQAWRVHAAPNRPLRIDRKRFAFSLRTAALPACEKSREAAPSGYLDSLQGDGPAHALLDNLYFIELIALCVEAIPEHDRQAAVRVDAQLVRIQDSCVDVETMLFDRARRPRDAVLGVVLIRRNGIVIGDIDILSRTGTRVESLPLSDPLDVILLDSRQFALGPLYWVGLQTRSQGSADLLTLMVSVDGNPECSNQSKKET